ncbi:glycosyltransferase, partial [Acinetobacter baumannii]
FRYLLIYAHGGVYLDLKSSITRPLDEVLNGNEHFILSNWDKKHFYYGWGKNPEVFPRFPNGEICQWFIISRAGHPYLR